MPLQITIGLFLREKKRKYLRLFGGGMMIGCSNVYLLRCGPEGIRTPGLLSAIEARSQLRYRPIFIGFQFYLKERGLSNELNHQTACSSIIALY